MVWRLAAAVTIIALYVALSAVVARSAPPPGEGDGPLSGWYHSLTIPQTGGSCCGAADCRNFPVNPMGDHYEVLYDNKWLRVPDGAVQKRYDNPTGDYVTCITHGIEGVVEPTVLCFFLAPQT